MTSGSTAMREREVLQQQQKQQEEEEEEEEIIPLLEAKTTTVQSSIEQISKNDGSTNRNVGYKLQPLMERSILMRLDVWPFLLMYSILIVLDITHDHIPIFDYVFPVLLMGQLSLALVQQWKVGMRSIVGFKISPNIRSMTHCLVMALDGDKHDSAHDDGIVAAKLNDDGVMIVRFRDIVFRSPTTTTTKEDADIALWTRLDEDAMDDEASTTGTTITTTQTQESFHRLRYPIHLPLPFYSEWSGFHTMSELVLAQRVYGSNTTPIELPPFFSLLQEQLVAPFFLFQVLCVVLWSLDECKWTFVFRRGKKER